MTIPRMVFLWMITFASMTLFVVSVARILAIVDGDRKEDAAEGVASCPERALLAECVEVGERCGRILESCVAARIR